MKEKKTNKNTEREAKGRYNGDPSEMRKAPGYENAVPGVNTPDITVPAVNPPVPNRAWTEMKNKIEGMSEAQRKEIFGKGKPLNG